MEAVVRRHQGVYLLGMGIISVFLAFVMVPLGVITWMRAHRDLGQMNAGDMDEAGRDLTRLARLLGIIATAIFAFWAVVMVVSLTVPNELHGTRVIEAGR